MRLDYDTRLRNSPEMVYNKEKMKNMEENLPKRDQSGNVKKPSPMKGSYAEYRLEKLREIRKKFNVDDHGFYKGGVPRQGTGSVRGSSMGPAGAFHDPYYHNETHDMPHSGPHVSLREGDNHRDYMQAYKSNYERFQPYFALDEVEKDSQYYITDEHRRLFWLPFIIIGSLVTYFAYYRWNNNSRFQNHEKKILESRAYEFEQVGPIIFDAPHRKFMDKFLSRPEFNKWIDNDIRTYG